MRSFLYINMMMDGNRDRIITACVIHPPMSYYPDVLIVLGLCGGLSLITYLKRVLTPGGSVVAFTVGMIIGIMGDITWVVLLLIFLITSFLATRHRFDLKKRQGVQEGKRGERGASNVLANGVIPVVIAVFSFENDFYPYFDKETGSILFICAIAVAAADTLASELGVFSARVYLITTRKRVRPGTDGGVSWKGQGWALVAAAYTGFLGVLIFHLAGIAGFHVGIVTLVIGIGFLGCQIDSVIGATLERRGHVSKLTNNLVSIALGTAIAWGVLTWIG